MRPIDADKLQEQMVRKKPETAKARYTEGFNDCLLRCKSMVHSAPTEDVEPVRHAKWVPITNAIHCDDEAWVQYQCSNCGRVLWVDHNTESLSDYPYCHCGAKMDLKAE